MKRLHHTDQIDASGMPALCAEYNDEGQPKEMVLKSAEQVRARLHADGIETELVEEPGRILIRVIGLNLDLQTGELVKPEEHE